MSKKTIMIVILAGKKTYRINRSQVFFEHQRNIKEDNNCDFSGQKNLQDKPKPSLL